MKTRNISYILGGIIVTIVLFLFARWAVQSYQAAQQNQTGKISIVASTNVWGDIASQVGGDQVEVTSILSDPSADPHLFESDAKTASQVNSAQIVIKNGLGYDEFIDKLLAGRSDEEPVLTVSDVLNVDADANPHLWYDLPQIPKVAEAIRDQLIQIDPSHADEYRRNTATFIAEMQPVVTQITPRSGGVAYTERVAEYLLNDLGLEDKTPQGFSQSVENGTEPTPQQLLEFEDILKSGSVKVLVYNNQATNDVTEQLEKTAKTAGVTVVGVSETIPKGKNFQTWQLDQLSAILKAL